MHYHVLYQCASYYTRNFFNVELSGSYFDLLQGEFVFRYRTHHYLTSQIHSKLCASQYFQYFDTVLAYKGEKFNSGTTDFLNDLKLFIQFYMFMACYFYVNIFDFMSNRICEYFIDRVEHNNCIYRVLYELRIFQLIKIISKKFQSVYTALKTSHKVTCN